MRRWLNVLAFTSIFILGACGGKAKPTGSIQVEDAWVRAAARMDMGQNQNNASHNDGSVSTAYMLIHNNGKEPDRLLSANTTAAHAAELHESKDTNGVMSMRPVESVEIPSGGSIELKPGGLHIMLVGLTRDLQADEKVELVLKFEKAGEVPIEAEVRSP